MEENAMPAPAGPTGSAPVGSAPTGSAPVGSAPTGPAGPPTPSMPSASASKGLMGDLMAVLKRDGGAMMSVAKNPAYLVPALIIYALAKVASTFSAWWQLREANDLLATLGLDLDISTVDLVISGVYGYVVGLLMFAALYVISTKWFKGAQTVDIKGFVTVACFISAPLILSAIPVVGALVGGIWTIVLFFMMMSSVMGFKFWKALGVIILTAVIVGAVAGALGGALGILGYSTSFSFDSTY
ncbi:MAG: YIP1 family protein [Candidatus Peregrinibacteria bacterium]|nr:YIP1 family protein [Candidatus Peregrinibacteria bacterium]